MDDISRTRWQHRDPRGARSGVRDVRSGQDIGDELQGVKDGPLSWTKDARGFFYVRSDIGRAPSAANTAPLAPDGRQQVFYHRVGRPQSDDRLMFDVAAHADWRLRADLSDDGQYLVSDGAHRNRSAEPPLPHRPRQPEAPEPRRADRDAVRHGGRAVRVRRQQRADFLHPDDEGRTPRAPRRGRHQHARREPLDNSHSRDVRSADRRPSRGRSARGAPASRRALGARAVRARRRSTRNHPSARRRDGDGAQPADRRTRALFQLQLVPPAADRSIATTSTREPPSRSRSLAPTASLASFETTQLFFTSKDGTRVPMFITARRGITLDGTHSTLLTANGSFNVSSTPIFSPMIAAWLQLGGIYAVANVRGGGEDGRAWHEAAMGARKQVSIDDFIAAAEFLISQRYTRAASLGIAGHGSGRAARRRGDHAATGVVRRRDDRRRHCST